MNEQKVLEFLGELTELSKKYGIYIGGCGCCGSPFGYIGSRATWGSEVFYDLKFDNKNQKYEVDLADLSKVEEDE